ncbi:MAG: redox-sensing transcriptional repressor Rex [Eubacteriales bacterium]|nr:redox-sensing transcriptional repressor Rex [Eubacteriales bacterium]
MTKHIPFSGPVISLQALQRMPSYLYYLRSLQEEGVRSISASKTADYFGLTEIQVRKDFAAVSTTPGKPKYGFGVEELIASIENYLGFRNTKDAILVGVGSLGQALLNYEGFTLFGLNIVAAFDNDAALVGTTVNQKPVLAAAKISDTARRMGIHIGIITVPAKQAQLVCDQLVAGGVKAIWNFAPVHLSVPGDVLVQNENMAVSLAILSNHLEEELNPNRGVSS